MDVDTSTTELVMSSSATSEKSIPIQELQVPAVVVPDGGARAWASVAGGWIIAFCTVGYAQSFGVFEDLYTLAGASTATNIAWIGSFQLFMAFAMGLPAGKLFDAGYFHHLQIAGGLLFVFSLFMLSLADTSKFYQIFLSQGVGVGLGSGLIFLPSLSVQAHHWKERRALAMGIVMTGASVGGIVHPIMHNQLFHGSTGFTWTVRASAFMTLGLLVIANCLMTTRLPPKKNAPKPPIGEVFSNRAFMIVAVGCFLVFWGFYFPYFYLQLFVDIHGLDRTFAFYTLAILNAGSILGRLIPNLLADRYGNLNVMIPICFVNGILVFAMFGVKSIAGAAVFSLLYGFTSGSFISLIPPLIGAFSPDINKIGIYMGVGFFITSWASLTGTPISGQLLGTHFAWWKPIVFSGVVMLAGTVFVIAGRLLVVKERGTWRV
ncbi:unnamed protein product [Somion occarium]|uniref:Major facilitator superfamily (MFS) profile domain-containing protein n=1 Tax=Somion occarium TaxID=3059160 RepID=A0ABP1D923_9APHY